MFTFTYETRYGDYKDFDTIKPGVVLDMIQDISIRDSASRGYGLKQLRDINRAWLVRGLNVRFEKTIKTMTPIKLSTGVKSLKSASSERVCFIEQDGERVAKSVANWFLFDTQSAKVTKIPSEMLSSYELFEFEDDFFDFSPLKPLDLEETAYTIKVANKEIDTNKHLNNQRGAELLMDALPFDFYFNNIRLMYKKQAMLGDVLGICVKEFENGYYVHLQSTDGEVCVAGEFLNI